jgi:hypothetical protein
MFFSNFHCFLAKKFSQVCVMTKQSIFWHCLQRPLYCSNSPEPNSIVWKSANLHGGIQQKNIFPRLTFFHPALLARGFSMEEHTLKNVNKCLNTNIYSYFETSGHQSSNLYFSVVHFFNTSVN